jgi:hypothetical protein
MRVRHLATQHPRSARCPLQRYFVRRFRFSAELMVSYFYLMIASDLCFATLPVHARHRSRPCGPRLTVHGLAVGPHAMLMIVIAPWIRAYQGGELFRHNRGADPVPPQGRSVSLTSRTGGQGIDP